jgi:hypothetical protein
VARAKLSGSVRSEGSQPVRGAVVELHNSAGDIVDQVQVDDDGRFTYHVSSGAWSLHAWDAAGHTAIKTVTVGEGEDGFVDIDLSTREEEHR